MPIVYYTPDGEPIDHANAAANWTAYLERVAAAGRAAWSALHMQQNPTSEWFENEWKPLIPQGCGCSGSANELLEQNPPRFDSPEEFFVWTVEYHNAVNQKLIDQGDTTKKIVSLEEAKQIWNRE